MTDAFFVGGSDSGRPLRRRLSHIRLDGLLGKTIVWRASGCPWSGHWRTTYRVARERRVTEALADA